MRPSMISVSFCPQKKVADHRKGRTQVQGSELLPSAYFDISAKPGNSVVLTGGGYGHGVGMSQTGADRMAEQGYTCQEILEYFLKILNICRLGGCGRFRSVGYHRNIFMVS